MNDRLNELLRQPGIWRAGEQRRETGRAHVASGFPALDAALPGGGWPVGTLTEILHEPAGAGGLSLLMPALARLGRTGRWIALIAPPYLPYAPALTNHGVDLSRLLLIHPGEASADALWAVEQALRSGTCGAVLAWPQRVDMGSLRRLQLAADAGGSLGLLFRSVESADHPSPAALRLRLAWQDGHARVRLHKCRGGEAGRELALDMTADHRPTRDEPPSSNESATGERPGLRAPLRPLVGRSRPARTRSRAGRRTRQMDLPLM